VSKRMNRTGRVLGRSVGAVMGLVSSVALGFGCGEGQADPSYEGEPLLSVNGQVEAELSVRDEVEVGVLWLVANTDFDLVCTAEVEAEPEPSACVEACGEFNCRTLEAWEQCVGQCPDVTFVWVEAQTPSIPFITGGIGQTTPVVGEFPAQFSLDILEPPPPDALIGSSTGERLAIGLLVALDPAGAPWRLDLTQAGFPDWLLGGSERHFLIHAPDGLPPESIWSLATGNLTLPPGYHLMEQLGETDDDNLSETLRRVPEGEPTLVRLRLAPADSIVWPLL